MEFNKMSILEPRGDPVWTNPNTGHKWWKEKDLTDYCIKEDHIGKSPLIGARAWYVECPNGYKSYVITMNDEVIIDSQSLESVGCEIDIMKFAMRSEKKVK